MKSHAKSLLTIAAVFLLSACAQDGKHPAPGGSPGTWDSRNQVDRFDSDWSPSRVSLICAAGDCPPQVGLLMQVVSRSATATNLNRCTATLIDANHVISSAHCVEHGTVGYFITRDHGFRKILGKDFIRYKPSDKPGKAAWGPDLVTLKLESPFDELTPIPVASGPTKSYSSLAALVVNQIGSPDSLQFKIDRVTCPIGRSLEFPFDISDGPDVIISIGCDILAGNSGAPMFAPGGSEIEAIVQANVPTDSRGVGIAANLRCQPLGPNGASPCQPVTVESIKARITADVTSVVEKLDELGAADRARFPTESTVWKLVTADKIDGAPGIEVIDQPKCLRPDVDELPDVYFLEQLMSLSWKTGRATAQVLRSRIVTGRVVKHSNTRYLVEVEWPEPFVRLHTPEQHPSVRLGKSFSIDIPRCAR